MKIKDKYQQYKNDHRDSIILIKSGNFYLLFDDDANIMNYLFNYKIINNKVGFPISSLDIVKSEFDNRKINYLVYNNDEDIDNIMFDDNKYMNLFNEYKKIEYKNSMKKILFDRIEYLIDNNQDNYDKIRRFVDEL